MPTKKIITWEKVNGKRQKPIYDSPKTPYKRLLDAPGLDDVHKNKLKENYNELNPFEINKNINKLQQKLFRWVQTRNLKQYIQYPKLKD